MITNMDVNILIGLILISPASLLSVYRKVHGSIFGL